MTTGQLLLTILIFFFCFLKGKLENICSMQLKEAENAIKTQFKMEKMIYCQDILYGGSLREARDNGPKQLPNLPPPSQMQITVYEMSYHIKAYFKTVVTRLGTQIPLIIQHYVLFEFAKKLEVETMLLIQDRDNLEILLQEKKEVARERKNLKDQIQRLQAAQQRLARFPA